MGANNANISRYMYDETKEFQQLIFQQGKPLVDAEFNDAQQISYHLLRRFIQKIIGDGSPDQGFKIEGVGSNNNFIIRGGGGTIETAGRLVVGGFQCILLTDRYYKANDNFECTPVSTDLTETVLTDTAANFTLGGPDDNLVGRTLLPDITKPTFTYSITANTKTTITVSGSMLSAGIEKGSHYRVELSTPSGADRTDEVYIDCYLDEIDGDEDSDLTHTLGMQIETTRRFKLIHTVHVAEGGNTPASHIDSDANRHYTLKIATIQRYDGQDAINPEDVTDDRPIIYGEYWRLWDEVVTARGIEASLDDRITRIIEPGTKMAFFQAAAPYGWTQDLSHDDKMLRVVAGAGGGSGGTDSPISHFHTGGDHVLTIAEMPAHSHSYSSGVFQEDRVDGNSEWGTQWESGKTTGSKGGNQPHNHGDTDPYQPKYIDVIVCTKD